MFVEHNTKNISSTVGATRILFYTYRGYAPISFFLSIFYKHFGATHLLFISKIIYKGQSPDTFVEYNKKNISSTVGATRILFYTYRGYDPISFFLSIFYKHFGATHLILYQKLFTRGRAPICL